MERKNRILVEIKRTMLIESGLAKNFWDEAVNISCYMTNGCLTRSLINKTPYEFLFGRKSRISHVRAIGCKCFVLINSKEDVGKFDSKSDEVFLVRYSNKRKSYRVFNKRTLCVEESVHVIFDESRNLENLVDKDDSDLEELLQLQRDSPINDLATEGPSHNEDMNESGDADREHIEGPGMSTREPEETYDEYDQGIDTA